MNRFRLLNGYQKAILIILAVMLLIFTVVYPIVISREGFAYGGAILTPSLENGSTVYYGKLHGKQGSFTVSDKTVVFRYGSDIYGPYTVTEDPTAIPEDAELPDRMTGIELRCGDDIIFRGAVRNFGDYQWLYSEDGRLENMTTSANANGNTSGSYEPSVSAVLDLILGPELTHKGNGTMWFLGAVICILTAVSILFVDQLFRWNLAFRIRDAENAGPSDWEIAGRYISWTVMTVMAMAVFLIGLQ